MKFLNQKIVDLRQKNKLSQTDFAKLLGVTKQTVSNWESGASMPRAEKIGKMCGLFGLEPNYFYILKK